MGECRLRMVVYQDGPGSWIGRGIEHDVLAEGRSIGETVRAVLRMVQTHIEQDERHDRPPLSAVRPASQPYWNAFRAGTPSDRATESETTASTPPMPTVPNATTRSLSAWCPVTVTAPPSASRSRAPMV